MERIVLIAALVTGSLTTDLLADVKLSDVFAEGMVLQQGMKVNVWGAAAPGDVVTVEFAGQTKTAKTDSKGRWAVKLASMKACGEPRDFTVFTSHDSRLTLHNVLVGEVWLCSGQSNMAGSNKGMLFSNVLAQVCAEADYPQIRILTVPKTTALAPQVHLSNAVWNICNPSNAADFSATAYFFGRELHRTLKVPVGLIVSAVGGTPIESWTSQPALEKDPAYPAIAAEWEKILTNYPTAFRHYEQVAIPGWKEAVKKARSEHKPMPQKPGPPRGPDHQGHPANLFNAMIAPLVPYTVRGVTWYQGEGNAEKMDRAIQYYTLFPTMIKDWRTRWGQGDLPFLFVQLASFKAVQTNAVEDTGWTL
jgi:sialate O-acetylesterase